MKCCCYLILFSICFFVFHFTLYAQSQTDSLFTQWAEFNEEENNLAEILEELTENPININTSDRDELLRIPLIKIQAVDTILYKRSSIGKFTSKRQIRSIVGAELYNLIKEFITIESISKYSFIYTHKSYYGIEPIKEIENGTYKGDAFYNYNKIQFHWANDFRIGMVTQKDIGEANYLDYTNGFIELRSNYFKVIAGSYYLHFGEGLVFSNIYGQQKSSVASLPFRSGREGGFATLSSTENTGLFGICLNFNQIYGSNIYMFYSNIKRDAQFSTDLNYITGIDYDGYHRSDREIEKKDMIDESIIGIACTHSFFHILNFGMNYAAAKYDPAYEFDPTTVGDNAFRQQRFKLSGSQINQFSVFYNLNFNAIQLMGEAAGSKQGRPALTQSLFFNSGIIKYGVKYWYINKNYQSPFGRVFDNSDPFPQAEEGFYFGLTLNPFNRFTINSYKIIKKDLWRTYFDKMPKIKDESFIEVNYQPENLSVFARLRIKNNEYFIDQENENTIIRTVQQQNIYRLQLDYKPAKQLLLRTRWESTDIQSCNENGSYLFEDIHLFTGPIFSIITRVLFYRTDSYNSRLYEYESDLPGSYANYPVYGEGKIYYLLLKWKIYNKISILFKYRYNNINKKDLTIPIIRKDDNLLRRTLRLQIKLQL